MFLALGYDREEYTSTVGSASVIVKHEGSDSTIVT